jgi:tetratricopeptide (TPR) repeat protein
MMSNVLWAIDNELDGAKFERLCVDLLHRHGYLDIVPIEPQDGGRDAEEFPRRGRGREGHPAFFQFSLEKNWKSKLRKDAKKLILRKAEFDTFVFVTSRKARGVDVDILKTEFRTKFGWTLVVYAREFLRLQLEEANPDLATKHLGSDVSGMSSLLVAAASLEESSDLKLREINRLIDSDQCDAAVVQLNRIQKFSPDRADALQLLAWAYYRMHRYEDALSQINHSIKLDDKAEYRSIRACILAEKGIRDYDRTSLLESQRIFEELLVSKPVQTWHIFYNLANVLGALGRHEEAIEHYCTAIQLDERQPSVWKNLASAYHLVGKHNEEMNCFDKALELDPLQAEALISKATSLMIDFQKSEEAVPLLELALTFHPDTLARCVIGWLWLTRSWATLRRPLIMPSKVSPNIPAISRLSGSNRICCESFRVETQRFVIARAVFGGMSLKKSHETSMQGNSSSMQRLQMVMKSPLGGLSMNHLRFSISTMPSRCRHLRSR